MIGWLAGCVLGLAAAQEPDPFAAAYAAGGVCEGEARPSPDDCVIVLHFARGRELKEADIGQPTDVYLFVGGADPKAGESPTLEAKAKEAGAFIELVWPGKRTFEDSSAMVRKKLCELRPCGTRSFTLLCHSKGCDPVASLLQAGGPADKPDAFWSGTRVAMLNPLIPGAATASSSFLAPAWAREIHPEAELRRRLFGAAAGAFLRRPKSVLILETEDDPVVAKRPDGDWVGPITIVPTVGMGDKPLDLKSLALSGVEVPKERLGEARYAHGILLYRTDLFDWLGQLSER